jgi:MFS family permease
MATGNFADLYGRRKAMLLGLGAFAVASFACGVAPTALLLNLARAAQGFGGALLLTSALAIISREFAGTSPPRVSRPPKLPMPRASRSAGFFCLARPRFISFPRLALCSLVS